MVNLILVCGQGSIGKSTFISKVIKEGDLNVRLDDIPNYDFQEFARQIQEGIDKEVKTIYADMSFDNRYLRQWLLSQLSWKELNLYVIQLRPPLEKLLEWYNNQIKGAKNIRISRERVITIYYNFEFVREDEFAQFNLNNLKIYLYDNYNQKVLFEK